MLTVALTKKEAAVLLHRLELCDCIAEACTDYAPEHDEPPRFSKAEIETAAFRLVRELSERGTITIVSDVDREVIEDAVDGNTFGPGLEDALDDELTRAQVAAWRRTIRQLNDKLAREAGIESRFPL